MLAALLSAPARGQDAAAVPPAPSKPPGYAAVAPASDHETTYVFGWGDRPLRFATPRGGSSEGAPITLAPGRALPRPEISAAPNAFARDRAAILALAGDYRVSFHEMESLGLAADYQPPRSYHSWATERVHIVEDTGRRISLQHTLVMYFKQADGREAGPALTKHWRQDWTYEDAEIFTWQGNDLWARRTLTPAEAAGTWSHAVFNLEDSPRYEAPGRWEHRGNISQWVSERAWRPLPRREHSVRSDYDVVEGVHSIAITLGWAPGGDGPFLVEAVTSKGGVSLQVPREELPLAAWFSIDRIVRELELEHRDWTGDLLGGYFCQPSASWER